MEKYAGIPKDKISSVIVFPKSWHDTDDGAVIWDKLIKAIKEAVGEGDRAVWRVELVKDEPGISSRDELYHDLEYAGTYSKWSRAVDFRMEIHTWYDEEEHFLGVEFSTNEEREDNPLARFEEEEEEEFVSGIDSEIVDYLESQGLSELKANRSEFDPEHQPVNTIYYDLKGYKLVVPPYLYKRMASNKGFDPNNVIEGS